MLAIVALGAFSLSLIPLNIVENLFVPQTSFGIDLDPETLLIAIDDPRAAKAGLHDGDQLDVARMSYENRVKLFSGLTAMNFNWSWPAGTPVSLRVRNPRFGARTVELRAFRQPTPQTPEFRFAIWTHSLIAFLWVLVGAALVAARPSAMTWSFYLFCLALHPFPEVGVFLGPPWVVAILIVGFSLMHALGLAALLSFAARVPRGSARGGWKYLEFAGLPVFLGLLVFYLYSWLPQLTGTPNAFDADPSDQRIVYLLVAAALVAFLVKLIRLRGSGRASVAWMFAGFAGFAAGVAAYAELLTYARPGSLEAGTFAVLDTFGLASFPLFIGYAIVWHRAFATGFVTNRVLVYGFFAATLGMLFAFVDWLASTRLTYGSLGAGLALGAAFGAGLLMQSQYRLAIRLVDRIFLPQRYAAGIELDRIREAVRSGVRSTDERIAADVADALGLASVAVFERTGDGGFVRDVSCGWPDGAAWHVLPQDDLCRTLTRGPGLVRLSEGDARDVPLPAAAARPQLAISVRRRGRIERAILIGSRRSGTTTLDGDEVRGLAAVFAESAA
jgi:hypothetical protein